VIPRSRALFSKVPACRAITPQETKYGFLWHKGKFTSVDIPGAIETVVFGINSAGDIVGLYVDATTGHGFLLRAEETESGAGGNK